QLLGLSTALLRLLIQPRILERDRGLRGEVAEGAEVLLAERVGRLSEPEHADDAEQAVADDERLDDRVPGSDGDARGGGQGRRRTVVGEAALPRESTGADQTNPERDPVVDRGALAPRARDQGLAGGLEQIDRALGAKQTTGVLDDQREQPVEVELSGQLALDRGQGFDVGATRRLQREQPRVLQGERGLVGEGLGQPDVGFVEGSPGPIAEAEGPDDPIVHDQRYGEHGPVPGRLDARAGVVTQLDAWIVQDVGTDDRPTVANGDPTGARAPGEDDAFELRADVAGHRHGFDVARLG